ncbi:MAG: tryptophan--tRNA ligase [Spirochaetota bacterium]
MSRVLSGIQPSGSLHIGNYFGMMKPMIEMQNEHELFCFIVNYHAMTSLHNGKELKENTLAAAMDFLALGLDPEKCFFWVQSDIPEVTELTWILSCHTSLGLLERSHSYKDKVARGLVPNTGLYIYPVLMAADILLFNADIVPVGKDQKQHLEITRDIAERFNHTYGEVFVLPEPQISDDIALIPGTDGQKMSKSYGNSIEIFEDEKSLKKKVMKIVTDSTPVEEPKDPEQCSIFALYRLFASTAETENMKERYLKGGTGYGQMKKELLEILVEYFRPYKERRKVFENDPGEVHRILQKGAVKTREAASVVLEKVREAVGLSYQG